MQIYQTLGYHVLAFDYRGYGDSSFAFPDEETMLQDALAAFDFASSRICPPLPPPEEEGGGSGRAAKIVVHGHSLGTGVATRLGAALSSREEEGRRRRPSAYVLEAPFNRMADEVRTFKVAQLAERVLDVGKLLHDAK